MKVPEGNTWLVKVILYGDRVRADPLGWKQVGITWRPQELHIPRRNVTRSAGRTPDPD